MAAIATQKPGGQEAVQLTFPSVFSRHAANDKQEHRYWPTEIPHPVDPWAGDGVQADWHEQKRIDAYRMADAQVEATNTSRAHLLHHHANYNTPAPLLSQRVYANPSNGNFSDVYAARPSPCALGAEPMTGGVLRTAMAQRMGNVWLTDRISQLQAMKDAEFTEYTAPANAKSEKETNIEQGVDEALGSKVALELNGQLESIVTKIESGRIAKVSLAELYTMLRLMFRFGATATLGELNGALSTIDSVTTQLRSKVAGIAQPEPEPGREFDSVGFNRPAPGEDRQNAIVYMLFVQVGRYLKTMIEHVNDSAAERRAASRVAVKTLGFTTISRATAEDFTKGDLFEKTLRRFLRTQAEEGNDLQVVAPRQRRRGPRGARVWDEPVREDIEYEPDLYNIEPSAAAVAEKNAADAELGAALRERPPNPARIRAAQENQARANANLVPDQNIFTVGPEGRAQFHREQIDRYTDDYNDLVDKFTDEARTVRTMIVREGDTPEVAKEKANRIVKKFNDVSKMPPSLRKRYKRDLKPAYDAFVRAVDDGTPVVEAYEQLFENILASSNKFTGELYSSINLDERRRRRAEDAEAGRERVRLHAEGHRHGGSRPPSAHPSAPHPPHAPVSGRFDRDTRAPWAALQGAWFGDELPAPEGYEAPPPPRYGSTASSERGLRPTPEAMPPAFADIPKSSGSGRLAQAALWHRYWRR